MTEPLTQEEREQARGNIEVGLLATLQSCLDDVETTIKHINQNDLPLDVVTRSLTQVEEAAAILRCVRDEYDMSIRAEAHEAITKLAQAK